MDVEIFLANLSFYISDFFLSFVSEDEVEEETILALYNHLRPFRQQALLFEHNPRRNTFGLRQQAMHSDRGLPAAKQMMEFLMKHKFAEKMDNNCYPVLCGDSFVQGQVFQCRRIVDFIRRYNWEDQNSNIRSSFSLISNAELSFDLDGSPVCEEKLGYVNQQHFREISGIEEKIAASNLYSILRPSVLSILGPTTDFYQFWTKISELGVQKIQCFYRGNTVFEAPSLKAREQGNYQFLIPCEFRPDWSFLQTEEKSMHPNGVPN